MIYVVIAHCGRYEDKSHTVLGAFTSREGAELEAKHAHRRLWEQSVLCNAIDKLMQEWDKVSSPPTYDDFLAAEGSDLLTRQYQAKAEAWEKAYADHYTFLCEKLGYDPKSAPIWVEDGVEIQIQECTLDLK